MISVLENHVVSSLKLFRNTLQTFPYTLLRLRAVIRSD